MTSSTTGLLYHTFRTREGDEEGHDPRKPWVVAYVEARQGGPHVIGVDETGPQDRTRMIVVSRHADPDAAYYAARARENRELVGVPQAAEILGLSYQGANDLLRRRGVLEVDRVGNSRRFRRRDIDRLVAEERKGGRPKSRPLEEKGEDVP